MRRYNRESVYCGALHALLDGSTMPFARELRDSLNSGGFDRVAVLLDEGRVDPALRSLFVAVVHARLQAERLVRDFLECEPASPTFLLAVAAVTFNRPADDTELLCGIHRVDWREGEPTVEYDGVGDDPSRYSLGADLGRATIEDV
jgi:hypothetical protein